MTKENNRNIFFRWGLLFAYCLLIFVQSSFPAVAEAPSLPHADKLAHFLVYGLLGILFFRAFDTTNLRNDKDRLAYFAMIAAALYGLSDEIHQHFVPSRNADILDLLSDAGGGACGVFFYQLLFDRYKSEWERVRKYLTNNFSIFSHTETRRHGEKIESGYGKICDQVLRSYGSKIFRK